MTDIIGIIKFICPHCGQSVRSWPDLRARCGSCEFDMQLDPNLLDELPDLSSTQEDQQ